jgi:hypothetical protein
VREKDKKKGGGGLLLLFFDKLVLFYYELIILGHYFIGLKFIWEKKIGPYLKKKIRP